MHRALASTGVSLLLGLALLGGGSAAGQEASPLLAVANADPLDLARVVRRIGDDAVLAELTGEVPTVRRLAAARAAPWMAAPERALTPLATLAAGNDPDLAPAATLACHRITAALDLPTLEAHEVGVLELAEARALLSALAEDETARPDVRRLAGFAASALVALGAAPEAAEAPATP